MGKGGKPIFLSILLIDAWHTRTNEVVPFHFVSRHSTPTPLKYGVVGGRVYFYQHLHNLPTTNVTQTSAKLLKGKHNDLSWKNFTRGLNSGMDYGRWRGVNAYNFPLRHNKTCTKWQFKDRLTHF